MNDKGSMMAKSKIEEFSSEELELADIAKAMAHPARIRIMKVLSSLDICMCGEIVDQLPLAQATVSQHLKELKRVGLINGEIEGPKTCYCINKETLNKTAETFGAYLKLICKGEKSCSTKKK